MGCVVFTVIIGIELLLDSIPAVQALTFEALDTVQPAMQIDDVPAPGALVQAVHVLGN